MVEIQVDLNRLFQRAVQTPHVAPLHLYIQEARALGQWLLDNTPEDAADDLDQEDAMWKRLKGRGA